MPADADPQPTELIAAAAPREDVLDLYEVVAGLRSLARYASGNDPYLYGSPDQGHWRPGEYGQEPATLSAMLGQDHILAATRTGEPANTAPLNTPVYRRHLATHQIALDPFAEIYLTAADALPGPHPLTARHHAGLTALHTCNPHVLQRTDPRPQPAGEDITEIIRLLPADPDRIEAFFEGWFQQRQGRD
ncbi:hypothetical protein ACIQ9Q_39940 [Streptomyces sp. NPDC094438]|uniref:hypothetical protein n=1 Tax=Streptomyces sp. NPDC094438 TaxID=3366061 RepID=UPI003807572D